MSTFTPNEITYPVTQPAMELAGLTTKTYGEVFGSPGPNGTGKSTTINMLCTVAAAAEGCDALVVGGVLPTGVWL